MSSISIPIIDITPFLATTFSDDQKRVVAKQLLDAFCTFGVFYITSPQHQVFSQNCTDSILEASKQLFALDAGQKATLPLIKPGGFTRGYVPQGGESGSKTLEIKEGFSYGYEWENQLPPPEQRNGLQGPNAWPSDVLLTKLDHELQNRGSFKKILMDYYAETCEVVAALMKGVSLALDLPEETLTGFCKESETISLMRLFHYFPYSPTGNANHDKNIGSSQHSDWGLITAIKSPSETVGLQLHYKDEWHDVPSVKNTLIINGGDYLSILTRGKLVSPLHRVISNGQSERYSMCMFYYPDYHAKIPVLVKEDKAVGQAVNGSYSLLHNQRHESTRSGLQGESLTNNMAEQLLNGQLNFGDYIVEKWSQVFRNSEANY